MAERTFESFESEEETEISSASEESDSKPVRQRCRLEYHLLEEFDTVQEFNDFWAEAKKGWKRKAIEENNTGEEIQRYM